MHRLARLDSPGVLHHIIIRGIERGQIFRDDQDRDNLVDRLSILLSESQTEKGKITGAGTDKRTAGQNRSTDTRGTSLTRAARKASRLIPHLYINC